MTGDLLVAIDQGTTSTRAIAFDRRLRPVASASVPLETSHPRPGWVEQDPDAILDSVVETVGRVLDQIGGAGRVKAVGLDNQGETVVAWEADTGRALSPAVVWQCRRSLGIIERLRAQGLEPSIRDRTGLPLDPYFSAGKLTWLLENDPRVAEAARTRRLRFGTVDAWITARLGGIARTDPSTASRTQLMSLQSLNWDPDLLSWFGVSAEMMPQIGPTVGHLGELRHDRWRGALPLSAMACDQQAALAGHGAFDAGAIKATYGTGVFVLANAGPVPESTRAELETSIAWSLPAGGTSAVLQAGFFTAGAVINWLRDDLQLIADPADSGRLAESVADAAGVRVLPALAGLGSPWWRPEARAVIAGLTAAAGRAHVSRAFLDGIANGVADLVETIRTATPGSADGLRVDGALTGNAYLMQRQADLLGFDVLIATAEESTALGIAGLAGIGLGWLGPEDISAANPVRSIVRPRLSELDRRAERAAWRRFVAVATEL